MVPSANGEPAGRRPLAGVPAVNGRTYHDIASGLLTSFVEGLCFQMEAFVPHKTSSEA